MRMLYVRTAGSMSARVCREPEEAHQLHFDMREAALRQGLDKYCLDHPVRLLNSCIDSYCSAFSHRLKALLSVKAIM